MKKIVNAILFLQKRYEIFATTISCDKGYLQGRIKLYSNSIKQREEVKINL